jgi:glycosyltransferase involved in cell wall biosynthesis
MLSVVIPVYNERNTIEKVLEVVSAVPVEKEIIVIDDGSTDGTREVLRRYCDTHPQFRIVFHEKNMGKGGAVRTGFAAAKGEAIIIQDADMEYNPMDYLPLLEALRKNGSNVIFGSRFLAGKKVTAPWHRFVNFFLTFLMNVFYGSRLTDMETCYKLIKTDTLRRIRLDSDGFEMEVELTAKLLRQGEKIHEIPVSYKGRSYHEGKKIGWQDGVKAVWTIMRYRFN